MGWWVMEWGSVGFWGGGAIKGYGGAQWGLGGLGWGSQGAQCGYGGDIGGYRDVWGGRGALGAVMGLGGTGGAVGGVRASHGAATHGAAIAVTAWDVRRGGEGRHSASGGRGALRGPCWGKAHCAPQRPQRCTASVPHRAPQPPTLPHRSPCCPKSTLQTPVVPYICPLVPARCPTAAP